MIATIPGLVAPLTGARCWENGHKNVTGHPEVRFYAWLNHLFFATIVFNRSDELSRSHIVMASFELCEEDPVSKVLC